MPASLRPRLSYANVIATFALFFVLSGGTAFALVAPNQVDSAAIIDGEVMTNDIGALQVTQGRLAADSVYTGKIADGTITGADVLDNALAGADIDESSFDFTVVQHRITGGACPIGRYFTNVSSAGVRRCEPSGSNSAFGANALDSVTSGNDNTAVGQNALTADNTAVGQNALTANTTGVNNSAVGHDALRANTTGNFNSAIGQSALEANTTGYQNSAVGYDALRANTSGILNSAVGQGALRANTTGDFNAADGQGALRANTTGVDNSAFGEQALTSNTTGDENSAVGEDALFRNTGSRNTAVGHNAGHALTTGNNNIAIDNAGVAAESNTIRIGDTQTAVFLAGVHSATSASGIGVLVNSSGKLGTTTSSRRFKENIRALAGRTDRLMQLRPVSFRYRDEVADGDRRLQYGLIAEEVAKVYPELVAYGRDGKPYTVRYQELPALLLNEVQQQRRVQQRQHDALQRLRDRLARLEGNG